MKKLIVGSICALVAIFALSLLLGIQTAQADITLQNIDTSKYPTVKLSLPGTALDDTDKEGRDGQFIEIIENGQRVKGVSVSTLKSTLKSKPEPLSVVMLIDSSGSIKGKPLEDAKAAANHFVSLLGDEDQISIISFSSSPNLVADYTSDKNKLTESINAIQASGETAVYDALSLASQQVSKSSHKQKYIILLSDGGDTVSKTEPQNCIEQLKALKVPVFIIALKSPEFDVGALENIANQSGGRLVKAINSSELKPFYSRLAKQIKSDVEVEYKSPGFDTKDIELDVVIGKGSDSRRISTVYENPVFLNAGGYGNDGAGKGAEPTPVDDNWVYRITAILTTFLASTLLAFGAVSTLKGGENLLRKQLEIYEDIWSRQADEGRLSPETNPYLSKALGVVGHFAEKRGFVELVKDKLEQAGLPLRPVEYISLHLVIIIVPSILLQVLFGNLFLTIIFILLLTILPMLALQTAIDRRRDRFNEMLPDTVTLIANSLRAGYSLLQAVSLVAEESKPPMSVELKRVLTEARLGLPLEVALEKMANRIKSEDFNWVVMAINVQREVGGNLAEVLDIVAKTIREREALKREVKSLSAEGRISAYILIALPFVVAIFMFLINREYMMLLFTHILGWFMVGGAILLMVIGIFWLRKTISIEV